MKISYIITPFKNSEYLIRCVNSLYRQMGSGYEVILAENNFASGEERDELERFLDEKRQLARISGRAANEEEKLAEAVGLISDDSDYVMLVDVNTVIAPVAAQAILRCAGSDLIIPAAAVRSGDGFLTDSPDEIALVRNIEKYVPDRICFSRKLFGKFVKELLQGQKQDGYRILEAFFANPVIGFTRDVCLYVNAPSGEREENTGTGQLAFAMAGRVDGFERIGNSKIKFGLMERVSCDFLKIMQEGQGNADPVFMEFQNLCKKCTDSPLLSRLVEQKTGCKPEEILCLSREEYRLFRSISYGDRESFMAGGQAAVPDERLSRIEESLKELKRDVVSVRMGQKTQAAAAPAPVFADPVRDVPRMYREGKLGLRTIWKSFKGWLGYKLGNG